MAYLVVDQDGTEKISIEKPRRFVPRGIWYSYHLVVWDFSNLRNIIEFQPSVQKFKQPLFSKLPSGTIRKLIGRDLSWTDEPVEFKE